MCTAVRESKTGSVEKKIGKEKQREREREGAIERETDKNTNLRN